jgi:hypothetical protein
MLRDSQERAAERSRSTVVPLEQGGPVAVRTQPQAAAAHFQPPQARAVAASA